MEDILAKKLKDVENKKILFNILLITFLFIVFSNSVSALENLNFQDSEAFTCPISDWDIVLGSCITNISDCSDWGRKIFVSNESYTNTLAYSTCDNYDFDSDVRSHWFTIPNNLSYIEASIYGFYGISEKTAIIDLIYQNGSVIAEDDRYISSGYRKNEWVKANITLPAGLGGITARLRIRHGICVATPCRFSVDNIIFYTSDDIAINMSVLEDEYPSSQFYGFVNELDGTTPIEDATLYFCRVSGSTNFCPTCDSVNVTRCLSEDYTITNATGYFNKTLINGVYEIWINKAYYGKTYVEETIVVGQTHNYSLANYTTNHTFIDGDSGGVLEDVYEYCYDTEFLTSNDDDAYSDASGSAYTNFYLPPDEMICSLTKTGYQGGEITFDYDYTCSEVLDSSVMTCEYQYITMAVYNESLDDSTAKMLVYDSYTKDPIEDAVVTLYESDVYATKTGTVLDVQTTDSDGLVSFTQDESTYYYISIGASGYTSYTVGSAAVGNFPPAGGISQQTFYLQNLSLETISLLVNITRDETAYKGFFEIICISDYGNLSDSYNANDSGQALVTNIPVNSVCQLTSFMNGLDYARCPTLAGGVCSLYITEDSSLNLSILKLVESKILVLEANTLTSLTGKGAVITAYNCTNDTYLNCSYYNTVQDDATSYPRMYFLNDSYIKFKVVLGSYYETNATRHILEGDSDTMIQLIRDENACSMTLELSTSDALTVPYEMDFDVSFRYSNNVSDAFGRQISCYSNELESGSNGCQIPNIPLICGVTYDISVSDHDNIFDVKLTRNIDVPQYLGWRLITIKLHTLDSYDSLTTGGNQTIIGQADAMESWAVSNFIWIIYELALVVMVLFLLTSITKMISGGQ